MKLLPLLLLVPLSVSPAYPKLRPTELKCLADNVYHEARGEPVKGQMLVARVTLNRAKETGSICQAVYAPYQFSWTLNKKKITDMTAYNLAAKAAYAALYYHKPVMYFHNKAIKPEWARTKVIFAKVGNHVFY